MNQLIIFDGTNFINEDELFSLFLAPFCTHTHSHLLNQPITHNNRHVKNIPFFLHKTQFNFQYCHQH